MSPVSVSAPRDHKNDDESEPTITAPQDHENDDESKPTIAAPQDHKKKFDDSNDDMKHNPPAIKRGFSGFCSYERNQSAKRKCPEKQSIAADEGDDKEKGSFSYEDETIYNHGKENENKNEDEDEDEYDEEADEEKYKDEIWYSYQLNDVEDDSDDYVVGADYGDDESFY